MPWAKWPRGSMDEAGAEKLLGKGDMLFLNPESGTPIRSQGVLVTEGELEQVLKYWQTAEPGEIDRQAPWEAMVNDSAEGEGSDALIDRALTVVKGEHRASASLLQRRLKIGYPRAARLIDELEELGVVGPSQGGGRERDVLISSDSEVSSESDEEAKS